ncbi:hypothetical protein AAMO2058_000313500 [Amorphochlora amoebiformis]
MSIDAQDQVKIKRQHYIKHITSYLQKEKIDDPATKAQHVEQRAFERSPSINSDKYKSLIQTMLHHLVLRNIWSLVKRETQRLKEEYIPDCLKNGWTDLAKTGTGICDEFEKVTVKGPNARRIATLKDPVKKFKEEYVRRKMKTSQGISSNSSTLPSTQAKRTNLQAKKGLHMFLKTLNNAPLPVLARSSSKVCLLLSKFTMHPRRRVSQIRAKRPKTQMSTPKSSTPTPEPSPIPQQLNSLSHQQSLINQQMLKQQQLAAQHQFAQQQLAAAQKQQRLLASQSSNSLKGLGNLTTLPTVPSMTPIMPSPSASSAPSPSSSINAVASGVNPSVAMTTDRGHIAQLQAAAMQQQTLHAVALKNQLLKHQGINITGALPKPSKINLFREELKHLQTIRPGTQFSAIAQSAGGFTGRLWLAKSHPTAVVSMPLNYSQDSTASIEFKLEQGGSPFGPKHLPILRKQVLKKLANQPIRLHSMAGALNELVKKAYERQLKKTQQMQRRT